MNRGRDQPVVYFFWTRASRAIRGVLDLALGLILCIKQRLTASSLTHSLTHRLPTCTVPVPHTPPSCRRQPAANHLIEHLHQVPETLAMWQFSIWTLHRAIRMITIPPVHDIRQCLAPDLRRNYLSSRVRVNTHFSKIGFPSALWRNPSLLRKFLVQTLLSAQ